MIVNKFAGTVRRRGADNARKLIAEGFERASIPARIELVSGGGIGRLVDEALKPGGPRTIIVGDGAQQTVRSPAIVVSNNLFGEGHLPYAGRMDGELNYVRAPLRLDVEPGALNGLWNGQAPPVSKM